MRGFLSVLGRKFFIKQAGLHWVVWLVLYARTEIDILKIGAVCKDLPLNLPIQTLLMLGLLRQIRQKTSYRLTPKGYQLLDKIGFPYVPDKSYRTDPTTIRRRMHLAELMLFLEELGINVFLQSPEATELSFLPSAVLRQKGESNVLGNTKLYGFLYSQSLTYIFYRLAEQDSGLYTQNEERIFHANGLLGQKKPAVIYTGQNSFEKLMQMLTETATHSTADSYYTAMQKFSCPVCFVPLSEDGLRQLRMMTVPDYKEKLCKYLLGGRYQASDNRWHDGIDSKTGERYQIGIDFNLKDFDKGLPKHLIVLDFQQEAAQEVLSGKDIVLHSISTEAAEQVLELPHYLPELTNEPYRTEKGEYVVV